MVTSRRTIKWTQASHFVRDQYHRRNFVKRSLNYQRSRRTSLKRISEFCIPEIIALRKLKYIGFPPKGVCGFRRSGVLLIVKASPSLRIPDCQEGHFFVQEEISEIVSNNCNLTSLIIPYAFVDDNTFLFIIES